MSLHVLSLLTFVVIRFVVFLTISAFSDGDNLVQRHKCEGPNVVDEHDEARILVEEGDQFVLLTVLPQAGFLMEFTPDRLAFRKVS